MKPTSAALAMRDPASAAIMGVMAGSDFGADFGGDFGDDDDFGADFGDEGSWGAEPASPAHHHLARQRAHTDARALLLNPNKHSTVKVEGYSFPINASAPFVLGTASGFTGTSQPNARIRPTTAVSNVSFGNMVMLTQIQVANVNAIIGQIDDAVTYSFLTMGKHIKLPPCDMSTRASIGGNYQGAIPTGFATSGSWLFTLTLMGPAALAGNG